MNPTPRVAEQPAMNRIYLDHNATSPLHPKVRARMLQRLADDVGNPGSLHYFGQRARTLVETARAAVMRSIGAVDGALTFVSGATEANNIALLSLKPGDVLVTSRLEHPSVRDTAMLLEERGVTLRWLPHDALGRWDMEAARDVLRGATLAALASANNELGNVNPVAAIAALCAEEGVRLHIDAAQVWGRIACRVVPGIASMTFSAHKAGGPVGVGALWVREASLYPAQTHGGHQERGRRAGTENALLIDAMGILATVDEPAWRACAVLRDRLAVALEARGGLRNGDAGSALPNTLNISFPGHDAEELIMALDLEGVAVSAGSACTAGSMEVSPVIHALGFDEARTASAIRWSLGPTTTEENIDAAIAAVDRIFARYR